MRAASLVVIVVAALPILAVHSLPSTAQVLKARPKAKAQTEQRPPDGLRVDIDVGAIRARGHLMAAPPPAAALGYSLSDFPSLRIEDALLDGGGAEWGLFAPGQAPLEQPGDSGPQVVMINDPTDFCAAGDRSGYSVLNVTDPTVVPFIVPADQPNRRQAAVIIAPGGGSRFLSWTKEGTQAAHWLNSIGISAFVLKYRVPANTYETMGKTIIDAQRALSVVRHRAHEVGLNASQIGFMGFSAGGGLAAQVSQSRNRSYAAVDEIDSLGFRPDFSLLVYGVGFSAGIQAHHPPTFIAIAKDDPCVPPTSAVEYYSALLERDPNDLHELHVFSDGHHGYGDCSLYVNGGSWEPICSWTVNAQAFIEKVIGVRRGLEAHAMTLAPPSV